MGCNGEIPRFKLWWTRYIRVADQHVRCHTHHVRVVVPTELESMHCSAVQRANVSVEHEAVRKVNSVVHGMHHVGNLDCVRCFIHTSQSAARTPLIALCHSRVRVGRAAPSVKHASCVCLSQAGLRNTDRSTSNEVNLWGAQRRYDSASLPHHSSSRGWNGALSRSRNFAPLPANAIVTAR